MITKDTALIMVDVQNDFLPGGALGVTDGDQVVDALLKLAETVQLRVASRDWHPDDHCSFSSSALENEDKWPDHCIADSDGAQLHPQIAQMADLVIDKATVSHQDAYSAFDGTDLAEQLRQRGIKRVVIGGLATDYCVKATALDAVREGFETVVELSATRAVDPDTIEQVSAQLRGQGVIVQ